MSFYSKNLTSVGSVLFLTGVLTGCATPGKETVSRASQIQAQALAQEVQKENQSAENCRSEAILAELRGSSLTQEQPVSVILSSVSSTAFAIAEVAPEISDDSDPENNDEGIGDLGDAGDKDGEGIGAGQGHDVSFGESC